MRLLSLLLFLAACTALPSSPDVSPRRATTGAPYANGVGVSGTAPRPSAAGASQATGAPSETGEVVRTGSPGGLPTASPVSHTASKRGYATWYDDGPGYYGAVRSWRHGDEPYAVQVCRVDKPTTCTHVVVRDYCACGSRKGEATLIAAWREDPE